MGGRPAPVTVACVYVKGEYPYTPEYVTRLYGMVTRWIDRPFRFVILTDQPWLFQPPVETIPIVKLRGFAPWTKLELFNPARDWTGRVLYLDLDVLLVAPLAPLLDTPPSFRDDRPAPFVITADPPTRANPRTQDSFGRTIIRRFNSSVMAWDSHAADELYTEWAPSIVQRLSGDQDWIGQQLPGAVTWPREWFPRISECGDQIPTSAKIVLVKVPKNHVAAAQWPWFDRLWGAA